MKFLAGRPFQAPLHPRFILIISTAALPNHHHHLQKHHHHWIAVKLTIYLFYISHFFRRPPQLLAAILHYHTLSSSAHWVSLFKGCDSVVGTWRLLFCVFIPPLLWHFGANHDGQIFSSCFKFYMSQRWIAGTIFSHFVHFWHFAEAGGRSQGTEASAAVYYGEGEVDWGRWTGKLPWNCPLSLSPLLPIAPSLLHVSTERKILVFYQKILMQLSCFMARGGCQLWVKSSMKCTYFMLQALFDGED